MISHSVFGLGDMVTDDLAYFRNRHPQLHDGDGQVPRGFGWYDDGMFTVIDETLRDKYEDMVI